MRKLVRDARAFSKRTMMGSVRVWFVVEGRSHDRAFYDQILSAYPGLRDVKYELRLAEDFKIGDKTAGGKKFALELFDFWNSLGALSQVDEHGNKSSIIMALDHDLDSLSGFNRNSKHILYTSGMDVEADILKSTDLHKAIRSTYSLPLGAVGTVTADAESLFCELAELYRTWITLGALAECCGYRGSTRFAQVSQLHSGGFGTLDEVAETALIENVVQTAEDRHGADWIESIEDQVMDFYDKGEQWRLVKGRWIAKFVYYRVARLGHLIETNISPSTLAKTALGHLDPTSDCFVHYFKRLDALLAEPSPDGGPVAA